MDARPGPRIRASWDIRATAGEPTAIIRVRNLQAIARIGTDAWGRTNKDQPILVSAEVWLNQSFGSVPSGDQVNADTVHYGLLSKAVLASLGRLRHSNDHDVEDGLRPTRPVTLRDALDGIWTTLTGMSVNGCPNPPGETQTPFLQLSSIRSLCVTIHLPKATLLGTGVSLTGLGLFSPATATAASPLESFGLSLKLHGLQVPTLIGVNANERVAKQVVTADIEVDMLDHHADIYVALEALVSAAMAESSFATLEALATHLSRAIQTNLPHLTANGGNGLAEHQMTIRLEKPTAVPLADGASIELRTRISG